MNEYIAKGISASGEYKTDMGENNNLFTCLALKHDRLKLRLIKRA